MSNSKRKDLSLAEKLKAIAEIEQGKSQTAVARLFGISQSQVSRICRNKEEIINQSRKNENPNRKRKREGKQEDVEEALFRWFTMAKSRDVPISGPVLSVKARELALQLGLENFEPTNGWLQRWKDRHNIGFKRFHGEKKDTDQQAADYWISNTLPSVLKDYDPEDIYNCDETGLYYRALPEGGLCFKTDSVSGGKKAKDRVTVLVCANMTGTDKRQLLVIGKSKQPRCFRGVKRLPVRYDGNKNAWMKADIFTDWLIDLDKDITRKKRKIVLLLDNCTAHPNDVQLKNVKLVFLPPNTTAEIQPCDQGIIRNLKSLYRRQMLSKIIAEIDSGNDVTDPSLAKNFTVLDAIHMIKSAWDSVKPETIGNCFRKARFVLSSENEMLNPPEDESEDLDTTWDMTLAQFRNFVNCDNDVSSVIYAESRTSPPNKGVLKGC